MADNQPRDYHGRWTASGVGYSEAHAHPAGPYMDIKNKEQADTADHVANTAAGVAQKLGYDPASINVIDDTHPFELNGKTLYAAGTAQTPPEPKLIINPDGSKTITGQGDPHSGIGTVTLYTPTIGKNTANIVGVTAHEITHQKFNAFLNDKKSDELRMQSDPDYNKDSKWVTYDENNPQHAALKAGGSVVTSPQPDGTTKIREPGFMRPDGLLNEPYASKYPAYQGWTKATMPGISELEKTDGVSDYSKEYWLGTHKSVEGEFTNPQGSQQKYTTLSVPPMLAVNETLAEIGRLKYSGEPVYHKKLGEVEGSKVYFSTSKKGINPKWNALYKAMDDNWKRRNKP
jgi:hypothetical protein